MDDDYDEEEEESDESDDEEALMAELEKIKAERAAERERVREEEVSCALYSSFSHLPHHHFTLPI